MFYKNKQTAQHLSIIYLCFFMNEFSNKSLLLSELPSAGIALPEYQALASPYLLVKRIRFAINFFFLTSAYGALWYWVLFPRLDWQFSAVIALLWPLLGLLYWFDSEWSFRASGYALREQDLHYKTGWWKHTTKVVSFNRIQHLSLDSGLIERKYGLASLAIYTAGAGQADFKVRGLEQEIALQIKDLISQKINKKIQESPTISEENE